ncbi:6862_t:CDS:2, partial [Racocetra fulgida]
MDFNASNFDKNIPFFLSISDTHASTIDVDSFENFDLGATLSQPEVRISRQETYLNEIMPFGKFHISSFIENDGYEKEYEEGYEEQYEEEYEERYEEGRKERYEKRFEEGYEEQYEEGYKEGYEEWYEEGYEEGYGINQGVDEETAEDEKSDKDKITEQELENIEPLYSIAVNIVFACWKELDQLLKNHGLENGFAVTITHSDNDKDDRLPRRRTYKCIKGRKYISCKKAHVLDDRDRGHHAASKKKQDNPTFHVDARFEGKDNHLVGLCWMNPHQQEFRVEQIFKQNWGILLQEYNDAADYLQWQLYECREVWALCFTHCAFNADVQSTQRVESYNAIIKNKVNGSSSLTELEHTIEKLLIKESCFIKLNEVINQLPVSREDSYANRYFEKVVEICSKFLTPAILKLQRSEINRKSMYNAYIIELEQLVDGLEQERIREVWHVSSVDKKANHLVVFVPVITLVLDGIFGSTELNLQDDFSHLEYIHRCHIFTDEVRHELSPEELYEMHLNLSKKMEIELQQKENQDNDNIDFNRIISNPVGIRMKDSDGSEYLPTTSLNEVLKIHES